MKLQRYTPTGKWSKPMFEGENFERMGGTNDPATGEHKSCVLTSRDGHILTVTRAEYDLLKEWFEQPPAQVNPYLRVAK